MFQFADIGKDGQDFASTLLTFAREQLQHEKPDSDYDRRVRDVEIGPRIAAPKTKVQKIDDFLSKDAIDEVPDRTTYSLKIQADCECYPLVFFIDANQDTIDLLYPNPNESRGPLGVGR